jgi:hypothetical protein
MPRHARQHLANVAAGQRHIQPRSATSSGRMELIWEQEVAGSNPAIPTDHRPIQKTLWQSKWTNRFGLFRMAHADCGQRLWSSYSTAGPVLLLITSSSSSARSSDSAHRVLRPESQMAGKIVNKKITGQQR